MSEHKWRNRLTLDEDGAKNIINEISTKLIAHYQNGEINMTQLNKINNLAANTEQLKIALTWL